MDKTTLKDFLEKKDVIPICRNELNQLCKDRIDFGFDSIYFRYALVRDELAFYKALKSKEYDKERHQANNDKMRFYDVLEQYVHAHDIENK